MIDLSVNRVSVSNVVVLKANIEERSALPLKTVSEAIDAIGLIIISNLSRSVDISVESKEDVCIGDQS